MCARMVVCPKKSMVDLHDGKILEGIDIWISEYIYIYTYLYNKWIFVYIYINQFNCNWTSFCDSYTLHLLWSSGPQWWYRPQRHGAGMGMPWEFHLFVPGTVRPSVCTFENIVFYQVYPIIWVFVPSFFVVLEGQTVTRSIHHLMGIVLGSSGINLQNAHLMGS